jgi:hypothetical protein
VLELLLALDRLSGVQPDPHVEPLGGAHVVARERTLHGHGTPNGSRGTVEAGEDAVVQRSELAAACRGDRVPLQPEVRPPSDLRTRLAQPSEDVGRSDEVRTQERQYPRHGTPLPQSGASSRAPPGTSRQTARLLRRRRHKVRPAQPARHQGKP